MNYYILCLSVFSASYVLNVFYITVLYHRGLSHGSVQLTPWTRTLVIRTGSWITGIDPKTWACMHRLHHRHSDEKSDPHSPWNFGVLGVLMGQSRSYEKILKELRINENSHPIVSDLDFPVNWLNRHRLWLTPYLVHAVIALLAGTVFHMWLLGAAYWFGIMSHPIQGWMVNSFAHKYGYRNFDTPDHSQNNTAVAWMVMGEGYQNNHHARPSSAKFSIRWFEFDGGYVLCLLAQAIGALKIASHLNA